MPSPIRLAVISPQEVVARGLIAMLSDHPDRITVTVQPTIWTSMPGVQVVLYDTLGLHNRDGADLHHLVHETDAKVLIYSRDMRPDLRARAAVSGADAWVSMSIRAKELVEAIELLADGKPLPVPEDRMAASAGLSPRGVEILALITQGLSNQQIAAQLFLAENTLKSHIRQIYRKIGARSRAQAVAWAIQHGFAPPDLH